MPHAAPRPADPRHDPITREIDRDERVILLLLRRRLLARLAPALAGPRDLPALLDALERALADARAHHRRLNDARISRRGDRPQTHALGPEPPPPLTPHACHGRYLGAFPDLAAVARMAIAACLTGPVLGDLSEGSLTVLALELHLRGTLWTLDHAGAVHVFLCPAPP